MTGHLVTLANNIDPLLEESRTWLLIYMSKLLPEFGANRINSVAMMKERAEIYIGTRELIQENPPVVFVGSQSQWEAISTEFKDFDIYMFDPSYNFWISRSDESDYIIGNSNHSLLFLGNGIIPYTVQEILKRFKELGMRNPAIAKI